MITEAQREIAKTMLLGQIAHGLAIIMQSRGWAAADFETRDDLIDYLADEAKNYILSLPRGGA